MKYLQIKEILEFTKSSTENHHFLTEIIKKKVFVNTKYLFINKFEKDLKELSTSNYLSDITVQLYNETEDEILKEYKLHKLFLFRSKHIRNILKSGMKESRENTIEFFGMTIETFDIIIKYLYTNIIEDINLEKVIEILVHCDIFQLKELIEYSLNFVKPNISIDNVLDILSFCSIYSYDDLIDFCIRFCLSHEICLDEETIKSLPMTSRTKYLEWEKKKIRKKNKLRSQLGGSNKKQDALILSLRKIQKRNPQQYLIHWVHK